VTGIYTKPTNPHTPLINQVRSTESFEPVSKVRNGIDMQSSGQGTSFSQSESTGCTKGRKMLLFAVVQCDLPHFLLEDVMENVSLTSIKDPGSLKMYAIELLQLLVSDCEYGPRFETILNGIPSWNKYKGQDYSLFVSSAEKKEYLLLDDSERLSSKLLTNGLDGVQAIQSGDED